MLLHQASEVERSNSVLATVNACLGMQTIQKRRKKPLPSPQSSRIDSQHLKVGGLSSCAQRMRQARPNW